MKPTQKQIAEYYGVTERTLRNWAKATDGRQNLLKAAYAYYTAQKGTKVQELTYKSSSYCEFAMFALFDQWESDKSISAEQIAGDNNIPVDVFLDFYNDYQAIKGIR